MAALRGRWRSSPNGLRLLATPASDAPMPLRTTSDFITTTANAIDGYDVVETLGIVRGIVVRSRSVFGTLGAVVQTMRGGNISMLQELCERTRADAFAAVVENARGLGANAIGHFVRPACAAT